MGRDCGRGWGQRGPADRSRLRSRRGVGAARPVGLLPRPSAGDVRPAGPGRRRGVIARDLVGYGKTPPAVAWPDGARIAVSFVVNYEEGSEQTPYYGDAEH